MPHPSQPGALGDAQASPLITDNPDQARTTQRYPVEFTGSGSEYFRIWIVNLLLTLVTFGLYYPWARVRKFRYFYGNTHVAGHALDFHGEPKRMLRGFLLVGALFIAYNMASSVSPTAGGIAGLIFMAVWPALLRASLQFRLANTSWRGLRFQFTGSMKGVYLAFAIPALILIAAIAAGIGLIVTRHTAGIIGGAILMTLAYVAAGPYIFYRFKKYQHENYVYGQVHTAFRVSFGDVFKVFAKTAGVAIAVAMLGGTLVAVLLAAGIVEGSRPGASWMASPLLAPVMFAVIVAIYAVPIPYWQSRMQNLVWTQTGSRDLRFKSHLGFGPLFKQTLINWTLMVLTLGFYWPFAAIAMARLRLQALTVHARIDLDTLVSRQKAAQHREGAGDAAVDMAGIDFGL